jgi:hypothetical protein
MKSMQQIFVENEIFKLEEKQFLGAPLHAISDNIDYTKRPSLLTYFKFQTFIKEQFNKINMQSHLNFNYQFKLGFDENKKLKSMNDLYVKAAQ